MTHAHDATRRLGGPESGYTSIIGIDCATRPRNVGLARADWRNGQWVLTDDRTCSTAEPPAQTLPAWIGQDRDSFLALELGTDLTSRLDVACPMATARVKPANQPCGSDSG